jgi:hypothetical protein
MLHDPMEDLRLPARPRPQTPRHLLVAGVAGAVALGVGAGLWARPAEDERRLASVPQPAAPAAAPRPTRQIEIVLDDTPAPIGTPIEVLPAFSTLETQASAPAAPAEAEPLAPIRAPAGLVRVQAVEPVEAAEIVEPTEIAPPPRVEPRAPSKAELRSAEAQRLQKAQAQRLEKAEVAAKAQAKKVELARAEKATQAKLDKARAKAEPKTSDRRLAKEDEPKSKALKAKASKSRTELARAEKTNAKFKAEEARLARAEREEKMAKADAKRRGRLVARLEQALAKATPHRAKAAEDVGKLASQTERRAKASKPKAEKAVIKRMPKPVTARGAGPLRKVSNRCVSADPGAALVCADPSLGAADRQMSRAYKEAEAAGVPASQLRQQHERWLAARSAAARDAPWAVQDVYSARIAELRDQARGGAN